MKKLLALILMLVISLPTVASEVKLMCTGFDRKGNKNQEVVRFDESNHTVDGHTASDNRGGYDQYFLDETLVEVRYDEKNQIEINRLDATCVMIVKDELFANSSSCTCVPFKKAF
jgi:hypothetical protein